MGNFSPIHIKYVLMDDYFTMKAFLIITNKIKVHKKCFLSKSCSKRKNTLLITLTNLRPKPMAINFLNVFTSAYYCLALATNLFEFITYKSTTENFKIKK